MEESVLITDEHLDMVCFGFLCLLVGFAVGVHAHQLATMHNPHPTEFWAYPDVMRDIRAQVEGK